MNEGQPVQAIEDYDYEQHFQIAVRVSHKQLRESEDPRAMLEDAAQRVVEWALHKFEASES